MNIKQPYLLFLGDAADDLAAKTALGVYDWCPDMCVGQLRLPGCVPCLPIPEISIERGAELGVETVLIGAANRGGVIAPSWEPIFVRAIECGMDIANGLHNKVSDFDSVRHAAQANGRTIHEVRHPDGPFGIATGEPRSGRRILTVGTDCSVGKMYTSLALTKELRERGQHVDFRATGQTGILIDGAGVCIDGVISDFISGAVEGLCPANTPDHWDVVEGQGSLFHPSFAGVSLGLLHGAQPDALVMCHEPTRTHMRGLAHQPLPEISECIEMNLHAARLVSFDPRCVAIAVNTHALGDDAADQYLRDTEDKYGLPCVDPVRVGVSRIVDQLI